jgi:polysaccharide biosynthesis protein PslJ
MLNLSGDPRSLAPRLTVGGGEDSPRASIGVILVALSVLTLAVTAGAKVKDVVPVVLLLMVFALGYRVLLSWRSALTGLLLVVLFIPIRRYALPGNMPFQLEPYRLLVLVIGLGWFASLLVDPRVRLRRTGFEAPMLLILIAILASDIANPSRVNGLSKDVAKTLTFSFSYFLVFYVIVSVVRTPELVERLVRVLVGGGAIVAVAAIYEYRTGYNVFNHIADLIPVLKPSGPPLVAERGGRERVYASAQHPIALGAVLVLLLPLAIYLARTSGKRRWTLIGALLLMGALATLSRTGIIMLVVLSFVLVRLRPDLKRFWPVLIPLLAIVHVALPNTLGSIVSSFHPKGGLVASEQVGKGTYGSGRLADLGPGLHEAKSYALFGEGFGTRITEWGRANAPILDDQWLNTLLETGALGILSWIWLFGRAYRRLARGARSDDSSHGWLLAALAASIVAFPIGMMTYDAFSFIQVNLMVYVLLALGAVLLQVPGRVPEVTANAT